MEDEYIRNYAFDPEFIQKKSESDRSETDRKKKSRKQNSIKRLESLSEEDFEEECLEAEVQLFRSVKSLHDSINHAWCVHPWQNTW